MIQILKTARRCSVPIVSITTQDERAMLAEITANINSKSSILVYDCVNGLKSCNDEGAAALSEILGDNDPVLMTNPVTALAATIDRAPEKAILVILGAHRLIDDKPLQQAICNARDPFKSTNRMLILLSCGLSLPADLAQDTLQLDDNPPDEEARKKIILQLHEDAKLDAPAPAALTDAIRATRGLSAYAAEQATALSLSKNGIDGPALWNRWSQAINSTPGLSVEMSGATLDDIGGLENIKKFARSLMAGRNAPNAIVRVEEIEKAMSGTGYGTGTGDSSGTSQAILGALLTWMQEEKATGLIAVGPAGSGKSLCSTAIGSAGNVPTITLDLGALKGSLVGQTEQNTRRALATIKALAGDGTFWVATCNGVASLPPELKRRFQFREWFFDLPDAAERAAIWKIWLKKYPDVDGAEIPENAGWTGAEIRTCVDTAYRLNCSLTDAAQWIVPSCKTARETIKALREQAHGRFLSASKPGPYQMLTAETTAGRKMDLQTL